MFSLVLQSCLDHKPDVYTSEVHVQEKLPSGKSSTSSEEDEVLKSETGTPANYETKSDQNQDKQAKPVIPGLGVYSDSSDSEASSSES